MYVDGTTTGTSLVLDIYPGPSSNNPYFGNITNRILAMHTFLF